MPARKKPVEQHVRDGTYRADRHGPLTPADLPADALPPKPAGLESQEAAVWDRLAPLVAGTLKPRDVPLFEELCAVKAICERYRGELIRGEKPTGLANALYGTALDKLIKLSERFGLSPADRAKLREQASGPVKPKAAVRGQTSLDKQGKPA